MTNVTAMRAVTAGKNRMTQTSGIPPPRFKKCAGSVFSAEPCKPTRAATAHNLLSGFRPRMTMAMMGGQRSRGAYVKARFALGTCSLDCRAASRLDNPHSTTPRAPTVHISVHVFPHTLDHELRLFDEHAVDQSVQVVDVERLLQHRYIVALQHRSMRV